MPNDGLDQTNIIPDKSHSPTIEEKSKTATSIYILKIKSVAYSPC